MGETPERVDCPNCHFVVTPGEAAVQGVCPNCERPFRGQPSPTQSEMAMRNMPAPGEADTGGNPLQEGILGGQDGGWANRQKRDESYASVQKDIEPDIEVPAEIVDVIPPEPGSIRPDKKRMDKQAFDLVDTVKDVASDVALPVAGGAAGFLVGGPVGAAAGAAAGAGAGNLMQGDDLGEAAMGSLPYAIPGGIAGLGAKAMSGAAAKAAAGGSTRGGIGSLMKSAWGPAKNMILYNSLHDTLLGDGGGGGGVMPSAPSGGPGMVQPGSYYSRTSVQFDSPGSQSIVPGVSSNDPEKVDTKEENDGDHKRDLHVGPDVNGIGGTDTGPDGLFAPDSEGLNQLATLLPKVLEYALSDTPGSDDPDLQRLHEALEAEHPGYMNDASDDHGQRLVMMVLKGDQGDDLLQDNDEPHDPVAEHQATALPPGLDPALQISPVLNTCPRCGGNLDPSTERCPQCAIGNADHRPQPTNPDFSHPQQMMVSKTSADSQGPHTDEQKALVAQYLQDQGRVDEIPAMILEPYKYADELSEIIGSDTPPQDVGAQGPPPPVDPSQQGAMPVPGMSAPPGGGPGPGASPMMAAVLKYAGRVDGLAPKCPNCESHSTGYTSPADGKCGCKACGHHWNADPLIEDKTAAGHPDAPTENPLGVPLADAVQPEDPEGMQDSSHSWVDQSGEPLKVGQSYEMHSANYDIPDQVRIDAVKPDSIEYTITGEYGMEHRTELSHEEAQLEDLTFVPSDPGGPGEINEDGADLDQNMDDIGRPSPGMDQTDLSTPHVQMAAVTSGQIAADVVTTEKIKDGTITTAKLGESPPRTADFDDINGPNGPNVDPPLPTPNCPYCGLNALQYRGEPSLGPLHPDGAYDCANCHNTVSPEEMQAKLTGTPTPNEPWNNEDPLEQQFNQPPVDHPLGATGSTNDEPHLEADNWLAQEIVKEGGAKFTPYEQRDFIDESGMARNSDKLDLMGTHYEASEISDQFLFGI